MSQETWTVADDGEPPPSSFRLSASGSPLRDTLVTVPIDSLCPGTSPRVDGESIAHVRALAAINGPVPPIVVHRPTMRVVDGMHRLRAAMLRGQDTIDARLVDGAERDLFVLAVELNATHGLPLSQADRVAAAKRLTASHPHWSDRMIADLTGLSGKTVAAIHRRSTEEIPRLNGRIGQDGKVRPLNATYGRRLAADLMQQRPNASIREIARAAGVSVGTAQDVRKRLSQGEDVVARRHQGDSIRDSPRDDGPTVREAVAQVRAEPGSQTVDMVRQLKKDPSLRFSQSGRIVLRLLDVHSIPAARWRDLADSIPPHCADTIVSTARECAESWLRFAEQLERKSKLADL